MNSLLELAERLERLGSKIERVIDNRGMEMSAGGQGVAIAMLVTLELSIFSEAAASLRALSQDKSHD